MKLELSEKETKVLKSLLSLDMDSIGFDDDKIEILSAIYKRLKSNSITVSKAKKSIGLKTVIHKGKSKFGFQG